MVNLKFKVRDIVKLTVLPQSAHYNGDYLKDYKVCRITKFYVGGSVEVESLQFPKICRLYIAHCKLKKLSEKEALAWLI
ncbi:MAG: hypothetical protein IMZ52_02810 [Actinobacteria bacterium]|nr:hypothetical protein [Actinomycetota bacterium]MBE3114848.1 hypothetical protein [Actinomycetota bacterium]